MHRFKIISDSSCDLRQDLIDKYDISIIPYRITLDGENYLKEIIELPLDRFYNALRTQNVMPKTSLPPIQDYVDAFNKALSNGQPIICFNLTSKFSGSYQSAINARNIILEENPDAKIYVVDTMLVTTLQGGLILETARMRENGLSVDEAVEKCEKLKSHSRLYVTVSSLKYLQKGGRIGKVSAMAGSLLNIKPVITFYNGELIPVSKIRGQKKTIAEIIRLFKKDIGSELCDYNLYVISSDERQQAEELKQKLEEDYDNKIQLTIESVGVTIGAHIGPTALGLGYIKKYETID